VTDQSQPPAILAGDGDRERSIELLTQAVVEGRLTLEEFSRRVDIAHATRTQNELALLTRDLPAAAPSTEAGHAPVRHLALCSRLVRQGPWEIPARSSFRCIFGTVVLDLAQARLSGLDTDLEIYNLFGTVTIRVPEGIRISVEGGGAFASQVVAPSEQPVAAGAPRLRIRTRGPGGTLRVQSACPPSARPVPPAALGAGAPTELAAPPPGS
jgi:hypothetical protein